MSSYSAPALDLVYFLASSTVGDLRRKNREHILTLYHTTLMTSLRRLSCDVEFSYEDLGKNYLSESFDKSCIIICDLHKTLV